MKNKIIIIAFIAYATSLSCDGNSYNMKKKIGIGTIFPVDGVTAYETPDLESKKLFKITVGSQVDILKKDTKRIPGRFGTSVPSKWVLVHYKKDTGWVFGGFISNNQSDINGKFSINSTLEGMWTKKYRLPEQQKDNIDFHFQKKEHKLTMIVYPFGDETFTFLNIKTECNYATKECKIISENGPQILTLKIVGKYEIKILKTYIERMGIEEKVSYIKHIN